MIQPIDHVAERSEENRTWKSPNVRSIYRAAITLGLPVAVWRVPRRRGIEIAVALNPLPQPSKFDFSRREPGFVFAPFSNDEPPVFIPADLLADDKRFRLAAGLTVEQRDLARNLLELAEADLPPRPGRPAWYSLAAPDDEIVFDRRAFEQMVRDAIQFIQNEGIAKVVVSRMARTDLPCDFDPAAFFASLAIRYPDAFVSLVAVPGVGSWIGASPELLLALDGDAVTTMSLAGTQPLTDRALDEVTWGRKELREQEMVSEYVRDFFAEAGVEHVEENGPRTIAAGSVVHLQTTFRARLPEPERRQLANHMLSRLHPTSAVCGMPRAEALAFIRQHEGHARRFYSGYLGPVNLDSRSYLYVNLRCTQLLENGANLYVGAGITADSDPTTEWRETELKAQTILDALTAGERVSQR